MRGLLQLVLFALVDEETPNRTSSPQAFRGRSVRCLEQGKGPCSCSRNTNTTQQIPQAHAHQEGVLEEVQPADRELDGHAGRQREVVAELLDDEGLRGGLHGGQAVADLRGVSVDVGVGRRGAVRNEATYRRVGVVGLGKGSEGT